MADVLTKEQRSYCMSKIRSKWTTPERKIHNILKGRKIRHKMHPNIDGSPDLILNDRKVAAFIHGCFWHRCPKHYREPKTNSKFWSSKIERNVQRDKKATARLKKEGYKVVRFWEHDIKNNMNKCIEKLTSL